ncbi:hypothetical protein E4U21_002450 [Claviceps maximensis]|nr:hypothetical protein E4U21_002450 [Claviceps maximensis]
MPFAAHDQAVQSIALRVKSFSQRQEPFRIYHGSTNSTRTSQRRADNTIDTSRLDHVLSVDATKLTALVEPNVPMDQLVKATLEHDLIPPVVMEFPGITVGGGFSGTSGESSSFRHGAFDATMESIEIVLADGTITRASKVDRPDVFWGAASAFGTLGVVTMLEIQLKPAKKFVELRYGLSRRAEETVWKMRRACTEEAANDFVDGIVFDAQTTLLCCGRMTDVMPPGVLKTRTFSGRRDPWFYIRAREVRKELVEKRTSMLKKMTTGIESLDDIVALDSIEVVDYIPLVEYLFRYDRGAFWVGKYSFRYFLTPFNRVTRFLLDDFMHTRIMYRAVHKSGLADYYMVQDVGVPLDRTVEFQDWLHDTLAIYPLWLCPLRIRRDDPDSAHGLHSDFSNPNMPDLMMNFGVWGPLTGRSRRAVVELNRALERKVQDLRGRKWLYAHAYYTEDEFWRNYDRRSYDELRARYGATYLPSVFDKVKVDVEREEAERKLTWRTRLAAAAEGVWPVRGVKGFYGAIGRGDYLMGGKKK